MEPDTIISAKGWTWFNPTPVGYDQDAVWAAGPGAAWTTGAYGALVHWDASGANVTDPGVRLRLLDLWGSAPDDVWAVGSNGTILHFDGSTWSPTASPTSVALVSVWGTSRDDAWVATSCGATLHWDGSVWSRIDTPATMGLEGIWTGAKASPWAVGPSAVLHYEAGCWVPRDDGLDESLTVLFGGRASPADCERVFGFSDDDVWIAGQVQPSTSFTPMAFHAHWDGTRWTATDKSNWQDVILWGAAPGDMLFGGVVDWTSHEGGSPPLGVMSFHTQDISGVARDDAWAVAGGGRVQHWDGANWAQRSPGTRSTFNSVWGSSYGRAFAVSDDPTLIHHWNGSTWTPEPTNITELNSGSYPKWIADVWGASEKDVWAVGRGTLLHWDGVRWTDTESTSIAHRSIWGSSATDAWVAASTQDGTLMRRWDGRAWSDAANWQGLTIVDLSGTGANDVWAVGASGFPQTGAALHFDGTSWSERSASSPGPLTAVAVADPDHVWAFGQGGEIAMWSGSTWNVTDRTDVDFHGAWAVSSQEAWAVGYDLRGTEGELIGEAAAVLRWDGRSWSRVARPPGLDLRGVWGDATNGVWAVGAEGAILRYLP